MRSHLESDSIFLHEDYKDIITANPSYPHQLFPSIRAPLTAFSVPPASRSRAIHLGLT